MHTEKILTPEEYKIYKQGCDDFNAAKKEYLLFLQELGYNKHNAEHFYEQLSTKKQMLIASRQQEVNQRYNDLSDILILKQKLLDAQEKLKTLTDTQSERNKLLKALLTEELQDLQQRMQTIFCRINNKTYPFLQYEFF